MHLLDRTASLRGLLAETGIQEFLDDKGNTEIAINRPFELWTESNKGWQRYDMPNLDYSVLLKIANTFAILNKLEITPKNPICSGVFPDEQRGQVVIPTACERGTVSITIRQPSQERFTLGDYGKTGRLNRWLDKSTFTTANIILPSHLKDKLEAESKEIGYLNKWLDIPDDVHLQLFELQMLKAKAERDLESFIQLGVKHYQNFCLVGATGSGKTTFTKAVCDIVPVDTRIVTIEDTPELDLPLHLNRVHLFYKEVTPKQLLASCMRMKPDRIFLTELRGDEAYDYLNALNTGHGGSITTVHANDCQSAYYRIGTLIKQSEIGSKIDFDQIMRDTYTTIDVMMFLERTYVTEVSYDPVRKYRLMQGKKL
ncbi:Flp pilus assembly complex ATPase component TadA [Moraxella sp. Tifton1]|uniref:ATPase, T2SS/T4P/T4SS family n=1 Tax=Moraxella oculi TaxID=2940516 RepID=UPI002013C09E|nr:ATPase, T2SS/T4P/T4SS family [Moraxella sp. Tifton1]MCL1624195.1 Flp pilus assembly complex ATPase component TadA [Moraxella sp. Tifton1]